MLLIPLIPIFALVTQNVILLNGNDLPNSIFLEAILEITYIGFGYAALPIMIKPFVIKSS